MVASSRDSKSSDSFCSLGSASTVSVTSHTTGSKALLNQEGVLPYLDPFLAIRTPSKKMRPFITGMKPPNVLVYSESSVTLENVKTVIQSALQRDR